MDANATTALDPAVRDAMLPFLGDQFGNPSSSSHPYGWQAQMAVKTARTQIAQLLGCRSDDVIFTSGATESNNLAILGLVRSICKRDQHTKERPHIITQATEHKAVLEVCEEAKEWGAEITILPVNENGAIRIEELLAAIQTNTILISVMMANNEIGTIQPLDKIAQICRERKIILHSDCAQSVGKVSIDLKSIGVDMVSISGHKIYGPKGIGALVWRRFNRDFDLKPLMFGGDQEKKLRPGTLNVPGIVGLGQACALAGAQLADEQSRLRGFQTEILSAVMGQFPQVQLNGPMPGANRLANNLSFSFPNLHADDLALDLSGIAYSSGSACNSANPKPSHVLKAIGRSDELARATLRLGLSRFSTKEDVGLVTEKLMKMLRKLYGGS